MTTTLRIRFLFAHTALAAAIALSGCVDDVPIGGNDSGMGEPCGPTTCAVGQECCNASCGICVEPGGSPVTVVARPISAGGWHGGLGVRRRQSVTR